MGQPVEVTVGLTNRTAKPYQLTRYRWSAWQGTVDGIKVIDAPELAPGGSGTLTFTLTPRQLGPAALTFAWLSGNAQDAITEVRLWAVP